MNDDSSRGERVAAELNEDFLTSQLGRYFRSRALAWMVEPDLEEDDDGDFTWPESEAASEVRRRLGSTYAPGAVGQATSVRTIAAFMLAHHAAESVLRHFLALLDAREKNSVAWLELARLQGSREFRNRLTSFRNESALSNDAVALFIPPELHQVMDGGEIGPELRPKAIEFCRAWLRHFAWFHLDSSPGYNAAKHGLSLVAGSSQISFLVDEDSWEGTGDPPGEVVFLRGQELRTLEYEWRGDERVWLRASRYVDPAGLIAWTLIASELLDWLWAVERARVNQVETAVPVYWQPLPRETIEEWTKSWGRLGMPLGVLPMQDGPSLDSVLERLGDLPVGGQPEGDAPPVDGP